MSSPLAMSADERLAFLSAPSRVGIITVARPGHAAPLASPVWFDVDASDGTVRFVIGVGSEKAHLLGGGTRATFIVQDEAPPQRFVALAGRAEVGTADEEARRAIARRYLPDEAIDDFIAAAPGDAVVLVTIEPETWWSSDFRKLGPDGA